MPARNRNVLWSHPHASRVHQAARPSPAPRGPANHPATARRRRSIDRRKSTSTWSAAACGLRAALSFRSPSLLRKSCPSPTTPMPATPDACAGLCRLHGALIPGQRRHLHIPHLPRARARAGRALRKYERSCLQASSRETRGVTPVLGAIRPSVGFMLGRLKIISQALEPSLAASLLEQ